MKTKPFMLASLMLAAVALTGCGSDEEDKTGNPMQDLQCPLV